MKLRKAASGKKMRSRNNLNVNVGTYIKGNIFALSSDGGPCCMSSPLSVTIATDEGHTVTARQIGFATDTDHKTHIIQNQHEMHFFPPSLPFLKLFQVTVTVFSVKAIPGLN